MFRSQYSSFSISVKTIIVPKLSHLLPLRNVKIITLAEIKKLELADPKFYVPGSIDMIIGSDFCR